MARESKLIGNCSECGSDQFACNYNHFETDELTIDSWEHKCPNCGFRDTKAFRSDSAESETENSDPRLCPFCGRQPQSQK